MMSFLSLAPNESMSKGRFRNILLIQLGDIGDVVLTTPTIRAVKEAYPDAHVSILVKKHYGSHLTADPNIHEVVEFEKVKGAAFHVMREYTGFALYLRRARYDLVIDLRTGDRGAFLSFFTGAPNRIGYRGEDKKFWQGFLFTKIIRSLPAWPKSDYPGAEQSLNILRSIGIDAKISAPKLYVSQDNLERATLLLADFGLKPGDRWYTINPFSRWSYKEWDREKWAQVINSIWERFSIPAIIIGSLDEFSAAEKINEKCKGHAFNLAGRTTLGELTAIIAKSTLHLGVDSAAPHIAAALGIPSATIHGPSDWRVWRVDNDLHKIIAPEVECVPCSKRGCENSGQSRCLEQLEVGTVIGVVEELLRKLL